MRRLVKIIFLLVLFTAPLLAQDNKPFQLFDKRVREEHGGFAGNKEVLSTVFNTERIRLGDKFEAELLKYLGNDVEKHYWISAFLEIPSYLHGNKPLRQLALLIKQQGLSLLGDKTDQESLGDVVRLSVTAAVLSEDLGLHSLAKGYKKEAQKILALDSDFGGWFPAMGEYERCLYDSIGMGRNVSCKRNNTAGRQPLAIRLISGGVLNGKAISKPAPVYPGHVNLQGTSKVVTVQILIDEEGKVVSAVSLSGHPLLLAAAVHAARQARFSPTRLSGKLVKVSGVLTYDFELEK